MKTKKHKPDQTLCTNSAAKFIMDQMQTAKPKLKLCVIGTYNLVQIFVLKHHSFPIELPNKALWFISWKSPSLAWLALLFFRNRVIHLLLILPTLPNPCLLLCYLLPASPPEMHHASHSFSISLPFDLSCLVTAQLLPPTLSHVSLGLKLTADQAPFQHRFLSSMTADHQPLLL